ncbi:glycosyltransferase [Spirochaeta africana]|nr:glycosyltransferase [Spirochaeta africana]
MKNKTAIGLCTCKRPHMLQQCLDSIHNLELPADHEVVVVICDNDEQGSARNIVQTFRENTDLSVYYEIESAPGIPFARNNVLQQCRRLGITELAFIDDDEQVDTQWLGNLLAYYTQSTADVVRGLVVTTYDDTTPSWISKSGIYQRADRKNGTVCKTAATNNVLFNYSRLCMELNLRFDESFGRTGGSDTDFFNRAYALGCSIHWVKNAVVYEQLEHQRTSFSYYFKRQFRKSNTATQFQNIGVVGRLAKLLASIVYLLLAVGTLPVNLLRGNFKIIYNLGFAITAFAKLLGVCGIHPKWDEYGQ